MRDCGRGSFVQIAVCALQVTTGILLDLCRLGQALPFRFTPVHAGRWQLPGLALGRFAPVHAGCWQLPELALGSPSFSAVVAQLLSGRCVE
jgi:hypothetical protein